MAGTFNYLSRLIKNPRYALSSNFLLHPFSSINTARIITKCNLSLLDGVMKLTNCELPLLKSYLNDIENNLEFQKHIEQKFSEFIDFIKNSDMSKSKFSNENPAGRLNRSSQGNAGYFLYLLVRAIKPNTIVETGVSSGESSAYLLQGLFDNNHGKLFSIDLPPEYDQAKRNTVLLKDNLPGWIIPDYLRNRWELQLGPSQDLLPPLLDKLGEIDMFWHDSLHTYDHMMFEYLESWKHLRENGIIFSDDIATLNKQGHSPIIDFAQLKNRDLVIYHLMGGLKK